MNPGKLYLVPAPLDFGCATLTPLEDVMPLGTLRVAARLQHWVCENAKTTRAYLKLGLEVVVLVGPVSLLLALAASGLNGQNFAFVGYVPQAEPERGQKIRELEALALKTGQTQIFIETPYRNSSLLQGLLQTLQQNTRLSVSSGMTLAEPRTVSDTVKGWRQKNKAGLVTDQPAVFAIGR